MPVRSLNSSVLKWPDLAVVDAAARHWGERAGATRREVLRVGYFGSYARGDWGVGSDLDLIVVVENAEEPFERRSAYWDTTNLPVPADLVVYTKAEWDSLDRQSRLCHTVQRETIWVYTR